MKIKINYFKTPKYIFIFLREISSFIIALYGLYFLFKIYAIYQGKEFYNSFSSIFIGNYSLIISIIAIIFALIHSLTWFHVLTKVQRIKIGEKEIDRKFVFIAEIIIWVLISIGIIYLIYI